MAARDGAWTAAVTGRQNGSTTDNRPVPWLEVYRFSHLTSPCLPRGTHPPSSDHLSHANPSHHPEGAGALRPRDTGSLLQVSIQPIKDGLVPELTVLRLQDPVTFIGKNQEFGGNALALEGGE